MVVPLGVGATGVPAAPMSCMAGARGGGGGGGRGDGAWLAAPAAPSALGVMPPTLGALGTAALGVVLGMALGVALGVTPRWQVAGSWGVTAPSLRAEGDVNWGDSTATRDPGDSRDWRHAHNHRRWCIHIHAPHARARAQGPRGAPLQRFARHVEREQGPKSTFHAPATLPASPPPPPPPTRTK